MPWYVYIALRHLFPQRRWLTAFTTFSVIGVSLGVMLLVVVISVMDGFGYQLRKIVSETSGDLKLLTGGIFEDYESKIETLMNNPNVVAASPVAFGKVGMQVGNRPLFPDVQGIDVEAEREVVPLDRYLIQGSWDDLDDDSVVISSGVAYTLRLNVGDEVEIYSPLILQKLKRDEVLLPSVLRVAGIFETGFSKIDESLLITTLRRMQDLYGLGEGVHAINIKIADDADADEVAEQLQGLFKPPYRISTWIESNAEFLGVLQFEKRMMFFLLFFIIIVGSLSIATSLWGTIVRKTREIGLLASMGATGGQIAACFCLQGFIVGICGTLLGFATGLGMLSIRDTITDALFWVIGSKERAIEFYFFSTLPVHRDPYDLVFIAIFTIIVATLAGLIPAYRAGRLKPADSLRNE